MRWLRDLHRWSAQLLGAALMLYTVTGVVLAYQVPTAGSDETGWDVERFRADAPTGADPEAAALDLASSLAPRARVDRLQTDQAGTRVEFRRPGRHVTVTLPAGARQAEVELRVPGLAARAGELHGQRKYRGGIAFVLWAALADASALVLLLFATSGVLLAWRSHPLRTVWIFGGASAFTLAAIFHLWLLP
ncbi:MAG: hypothetical protein GY937_00495 [bacterium]|nr:hypothetical protein [bacterium]